MAEPSRPHGAQTRVAAWRRRGSCIRSARTTFGRDVFSRTVWGARLSLQIGLFVATLTALSGTCVGLIAGYFRRLDTPIMRVMDGMMAFPGILLAIALMSAMGPSTFNVITALTIVYTPPPGQGDPQSHALLAGDCSLWRPRTRKGCPTSASCCAIFCQAASHP